MKKEIKVWDIFIRFFHWIIVLAFIIAYASEDDLMLIHSWAGYLILALVILRILYGFVGTRYARFSNFVVSPTIAIRYVKDTLLFKSKRYIGHNPAGGFMILLMLVGLVITCISGTVALAVEERAGPFVALLSYMPYWLLSPMEDLHEFFANLTVLLIAAHLAGVLIESIVHNENLIRSMFTGRKKV